VASFEYFLWRLSRHLVDSIEPRLPDEAEPLVEVTDNGDAVVIAAELPQVSPHDIRVTVGARSVTITVEERGFTSYSETFETGRVSPNAADIHFRNGVLEVRVPMRKSIF
jgi:HSP20 family molecular chaperone IbpA